MPYQSRLEPLKQDIDKWKQAGWYAIVLLTGGEARGKRLQKALMEQRPSVYAETLDGNLITREVILLPVAWQGLLCMPGPIWSFSAIPTSTARPISAPRRKQNAGERIASFTDHRGGRLRGARPARRGSVQGRCADG